MSFKFEKLLVWQRAIELSNAVNELVKKFPQEERYVLASQIQRASDSVALNIAEGSTGQTNKEFNRFLSMAQRSALEVVTCLYLGRGRRIINKADFEFHYKELNELVKMIQGLRKTLLTVD